MDHFLVGEGVDLWPSVISVKVAPKLVGGDTILQENHYLNV